METTKPSYSIVKKKNIYTNTKQRRSKEEGGSGERSVFESYGIMIKIIYVLFDTIKSIIENKQQSTTEKSLR